MSTKNNIGWKNLRKLIISIYGPHCMRCGDLPRDKRKVHGDHIIPKCKDKSKKLDPYNIQVLCEACNCSIKNTGEEDYRNEGHILKLRYEVHRGTFNGYTADKRTSKGVKHKSPAKSKVSSKDIYDHLPARDKEGLKFKHGDYLTVLSAITKKKSSWLSYLKSIGIDL